MGVQKITKKFNRLKLADRVKAVNEALVYLHSHPKDFSEVFVRFNHSGLNDDCKGDIVHNHVWGFGIDHQIGLYADIEYLKFEYGLRFIAGGTEGASDPDPCSIKTTRIPTVINKGTVQFNFPADAITVQGYNPIYKYWGQNRYSPEERVNLAEILCKNNMSIDGKSLIKLLKNM